MLEGGELALKVAPQRLGLLTPKSGNPRMNLVRRRLSTLTLQSLLLSISLLFSFSDFPCCFVALFPFFSRDFKGSAKRKTLAFFGVSLVKSKGWRARGN